LISIRKATSDLDKMAEMLETITASFEQSIRSTGQYAIEFNANDAEVFRRHLETLREQLAASTDPDAWKSIEASFRGELRDYRDKGAERLKKLRGEIKAAAEAMQVFGDLVNSSAADHEVQIRTAMDRLAGLAASAGLAEMREGIGTAITVISKSVDSMRSSHQVALAQMRDEIRLLHMQIDVERRSAYMDRATGVWNRQKLDSHINALIASDEPFCLLLVCVRNLKHLDRRHSKSLIAGALKALLQRFAVMLGDNVVIGRWNEEHFVAILEDSSSAVGVSRQAQARLSGSYSVQENGLSHSVMLQAQTGIVERQPGISETALQQKLLQMSQALNGC